MIVIYRNFRKDWHTAKHKTMKITRIIALALALVTASALVACNNSSNDDTTTTTAGTTTTVSTTTKAPNNNPDEPYVPEKETPATGLDLPELMGNGSNLASAVDLESITLNGLTPFSDKEGADKLFDRNTTSSKLAGNGMAATGAELTWTTKVETTIFDYILYTGDDSAQYKRTPLAWTFSGSTDGENWTVIDEVANSAMADVDATPYGFEVDNPTGYTHYKLVITKTSTSGELQFNELVLIGDAIGVVDETPVTDADEIAAMLAGGTNLTANVKDVAASGWTAFNAEQDVDSMFDGDTLNTKMGGSSSNPVVTVTWSTDVATTVKNYIIYNGADSATWARTPISWVLYGSNDGENWTIIDAVSHSGMENTDSTPYGFTVDVPTAYTQYTMCFTRALDQNGNPISGNYQLQMNELVLIGDAAAAK